jgi:hypothetical protein
MYREGIILVSCLFINLSFANAQQDTKEEIEDIIFDFRIGVDSKIKDEAAKKLVEMGEQVVPILIEYLKEQLPEPIETRVKEANSQKGTLLSMQADGSSIPIQGWAETTLKRIGESAVPKLIESILNQPETISRVVRILGDIGDKRAVSPLISVLNDTNNNFYIRTMAAYALGKLGSPESIPHLIEALKGQRNDPYNTDKLANMAADSLAKLSGQSFGFTLTFDTTSKAGDKSANFKFEGNQSEKEKTINEWKIWWRQYSTILIDIPRFLNTYATYMKNEDTKSIQELRGADYTQRIDERVLDDLIPKNKENILLNYTKALAESYQQTKSKDYRIHCTDIKIDQDHIIVFAEDIVTLDFDGYRRRFTSDTKRILVKNRESYKIIQENLSMWIDTTYLLER